jgi:hypothetical protein
MAIENQLIDQWKENQDRSLLEMATGYRTSKDIPPLTKMTRGDAHRALMVAGMSPGIGNASDLVNASLYLLEGKFGEAALSAAAAVPVFGVLFSGLRKGKTSYRLYRGNKGFGVNLKTLPKEKSIKSMSRFSAEDRLYTTLNPEVAMDFAGQGGQLLKFDVPLKYIKKHGVADTGWKPEMAISFSAGLPKKFLSGTVRTSDMLTPELFKKSLAFRNFIGKKGLRDIEESKSLFDKVLKNKSIVKNTMKDIQKEWTGQLDIMDDLLAKHYKKVQ